jgi:hypothetical protein
MKMGAFLLRCSVLLSLAGCSGSTPEPVQGTAPRPRIAVEQIEELRGMEALLPLAPDSVVERYKRYTQTVFYQEFGKVIEAVSHLMDSLNAPLPRSLRLDTLSIDHTFENIGVAAHSGRTIYLSSSYFFLFDDPAVIRSVIYHEYGHVYYETLADTARTELLNLWGQMRERALFYLVVDGEYSGNARFGGHPEESPEELYASAFNLFRNRSHEIEVRLRYLDPAHQKLVHHLGSLVLGTIPPSPR